MKSFVKETTHLKRMSFLDFGWGNGYVAIPKGHTLYGKSYDEIHDLIPMLEVNGGLTFSEKASDLDWVEIPSDCKDCWIVGFDTAHSWDTLEHWPKEMVEIEAEQLKERLLSYESASV